MNCFILTPILLVVWGSLAWRYQTVVPCLYSLIPVVGYEMSPLPWQLDKLQHIMLDSYPLCSGYLLQLSIKCNLIKFLEIYIFIPCQLFSLVWGYNNPSELECTCTPQFQLM